jgi:hypothetical protein
MVEGAMTLTDGLRSRLFATLSELAEKYDLFDAMGRPRSAFILDTLMRYSCLGCIERILSRQMPIHIDAIHMENHRLAINLLTDKLQYYLRRGGFHLSVQDEVEGNCGRVDVLIRRVGSGVLLDLGRSRIVIEVKTGLSLSYTQLFRYLISDPDIATIVVWRVRLRQILIIHRSKVEELIKTYMKVAIRRGEKLLRGEITPCDHNPPNRRGHIIQDPQRILDDFLSALIETLPRVVEAILHVLRELGGR